MNSTLDLSKSCILLTIQTINWALVGFCVPPKSLEMSEAMGLDYSNIQKRPFL